MTTSSLRPPPISRVAAAPHSDSRLLVHRCACGGSKGPTGECAECRRKRMAKPNQRPQPKLRVSTPGDPQEREADRIAAAVMRMPDGPTSAGRISIQRPAGPGLLARQEVPENEEELDDSVLLSMKEAAGGDLSIPAGFGARLGSVRRGGAPLQSGLRDTFQSRFGHDFSRVRVHTGTDAHESARAIRARAYTVGSDIVFAAGEYRPAEQAGQALIAHELVHVLQQAGGSPTVMRACDCTALPGARTPTAAEDTLMSRNFPRLVRGDWCVIGNATATYNCIAWSVGDTSQWIWNQVDRYGDNDGTVSISDFDAFYDQTMQLVPATSPTSNTKVALFAKGTTPTHAAAVADISSCGSVPFTSKLGRSVRMAHDLYQLEGGPTYGNVVRYYDR